MRLTADLLLRAESFLNAYMDRELNLRGYKIPAIENIAVLQDQFDVIDFSDNDIKKLDNFPTMKRLDTLLLNSNSIARISSSLGRYLVNLTALVLTNNRIFSLSEIDSIASLPKLETLSLLDNPVTKKQHYRLYVIHKIPTVKYLDFTKVRVAEREAAADFFAAAEGKAFAAAVEQEGKLIASSGTAAATGGVNGSSSGSSGGGNKTALVLTEEQKALVKAAIESATTKEEIDIIEKQLKIEEIAPLVYTPTVGIVCQQFGHRFTRPRGMYFSTKDRGNFGTMVYNWPHDDVHVIVVTDGSRILGLGDLGAHGMGIPIGKLALYCAAGGIAPHRVLPITLDVGTNNKQLREDPNYVGLPHERITGAEYFDFIDEFMQAVYSRWPDVVVQFEDFETSKAVPLLQQYRNEYRCFNDDIQGTGCVTLAGIIAAAKTAGVSITDLRFACAGAGSAGLGVCAQIVDGMVQEGMSREDAMRQFVVFSSKGALGKADGSNGDPNHKRGLNSDTTPWVNAAVSDGDSMLQVMKSFKPDVLLGLSTVPKIFNEELIRTMAAQCKIPIIMPMSNPTSKSECTAEEAYTWTDGRAIVATGSPFDAFELPGSNGKKLIPSQCNNMYVFPGLGLAASVAGIKHITDEMLYLAAVACADSRTAEEISEGRTFPRIRRIREVSLNVACAVIEEGRRTDLCTKLPEEAVLKEGLREYVQKKMYFPAYVPLL